VDNLKDREYVHIHTPIMTSSDCEGAGEAFRITTDPPQSSFTSKQEPFFPSPAYLTVSSQLNLEAPTHALSRAYTLSPSFRAEPSATSRHLAEFYMLEAEVAFVEELGTLMDTVEEGVKRVIGNVLQGTGKRSERARSDLSAIAKSLEEDKEELDGGIAADRMEAFTSLLAKPFARVSYTEAVETLAKRHANVPFEFEPIWGASLQSEHEKYLAAEVYAGPVFVTDYPKQLKPFYMRQNQTEPGRETVACFDLLAPGIGELAGGSLREERLAHLVRAIDEAGMSRPAYEWYLDLRRYGTVKHGGWGMGFERFICWVTGVPNVRDVVAFPRWKGHCRY
jgi:asparaginyl-tRNA synthetase